MFEIKIEIRDKKVDKVELYRKIECEELVITEKINEKISILVENTIKREDKKND